MSERKRVLGVDLRLKDEEMGVDLAISPTGDLQTVSEEMNVGQAVISRIRTRKGELLDLGHRQFGSRLYELVGEPNNEATRELVRNIAKETLGADPRIREIRRIDVKPSKFDPHRVDLEITVIAIRSETPINIVYPFYLEVA
jgi:phage baseplate assembly protein W